VVVVVVVGVAAAVAAVAAAVKKRRDKIYHPRYKKISRSLIMMRYEI